MASQMAMITAAASQLVGLPPARCAWARARQSAITGAGMSLSARAIPAGTSTRSSR